MAVAVLAALGRVGCRGPVRAGPAVRGSEPGSGLQLPKQP